jgi:mannosyltransferase OCH1-like enzyme
VENYTSYEQTIQRSNILRYLLLHHYGGIYLDLDISCLQPLDNLLHVPFLTSSTSKRAVGVNNAFILAKPQHRFLDLLVHDRIASHNRGWPSPWFEAMITTGYMFISNGWMEYVEQHKRFAREDPVYLLADDNGKFKGHALGGRVTTPLFKHGSAKQ